MPQVCELAERAEHCSLSDTGNWTNQNVVFTKALLDMFPLAKAILKGALQRDECRGAHFKPEFAMPGHRRPPTRPSIAARPRPGATGSRKTRASGSNRRSPRYVADGEPELTYEERRHVVDPAAAAAVWPGRRRSDRRSLETAAGRQEPTGDATATARAAKAAGRLPPWLNDSRSLTAAIYGVTVSSITRDIMHAMQAHEPYGITATVADGHRAARRSTCAFCGRTARASPAIGNGIASTRENDMNVISVLQRIAAQAETVDGDNVAPVAWDCNCLEEVCGACTMLVNGRVRQACTALVDRLLDEHPEEIELRPMTKFPVVRDLVVESPPAVPRLEKVKAWVPVDGYYDLGPGPRQSPEQQQQAYPLSECMSCGCCLDACPQYSRSNSTTHEGESDADFAKREQQAFDDATSSARMPSARSMLLQLPSDRQD